MPRERKRRNAMARKRRVVQRRSSSPPGPETAIGRCPASTAGMSAAPCGSGRSLHTRKQRNTRERCGESESQGPSGKWNNMAGMSRKDRTDLGCKARTPAGSKRRWSARLRTEQIRQHRALSLPLHATLRKRTNLETLLLSRDGLIPPGGATIALGGAASAVAGFAGLARLARLLPRTARNARTNQIRRTNNTEADTANMRA